MGNYADSQELEMMIHRLDITPSPEMELNVNDLMSIYNWLKELQMYRNIGPLSKVERIGK